MSNDDDDDAPVIKASETDHWSTVAYWEGVAESVLRVTSAGFAGSLVGLAWEKSQAMEAAAAAAARGEERLPVVVGGERTVDAQKRRQPSLPRRPPQVTPKVAPVIRNLPYLWSVRCMLLATILETSRTISPTRHLLEWMEENERTLLDLSFLGVFRPAAISVGDYAIGGAVAGLAGSLATRQRSLRFGLGTGLALGLCAGMLQGGMDIASAYVLEQQQQQREAEPFETEPRQ